jgi:hypothetical protein
MIRLLQWWGIFLNLLGIPGFVRDTEYKSANFGTLVRVKRGQLFTVVSVNGLDVYFSRFTGTIDGVGFSPASGCKPGLAPGSIHSGAILGQRWTPTQTQKQSAPDL